MAVLAQTAAAPAAAQGSDAKPVYRCPGPPVLYTDGLTPDEAKDRGCRAVDGVSLTVVRPARPSAPLGSDAASGSPSSASAPASAPGARPAPAGAAPADSRVDPAVQRRRDAEARRILETELRSGEQQLASMRREFNDGDIPRRGDERNFARFQERVTEMRTAIERKEADLAALRRELSKLPP